MVNREATITTEGATLKVLFTHRARLRLEKDGMTVQKWITEHPAREAASLEKVLLIGLECWREKNAPSEPAWTLDRVRDVIDEVGRNGAGEAVEHAFTLGLATAEQITKMEAAEADGPKAP